MCFSDKWHQGCARSHLIRRKRFDDTALGDSPVATLADDAIEFAAQSIEIRDFPIHLRQVLARNGIYSFA